MAHGGYCELAVARVDSVVVIWETGCHALKEVEQSRGMTVPQVTPPTPAPISLEAHLLLQPPGPRRLLQKSEQHVSDTCCSIKSKTISTDGGLRLIGQGTFGWMLTDAKGKLAPSDGC